MKKILITGANSYVGTNVEKWLMKEPDKYYVETLNMKDSNWKEFDFSKFDVVFHVAGIAHIKEKKSNKKLFFEINKELAIECAYKAKSANVKQFIFMSSMSVFGKKNGEITTNTQPKPDTYYGQSKYYAEQIITDLKTESFHVVCLRPPLVYGKNCKGNYQKLSSLVKKTLFFPVKKTKRSMIYIDNLSIFVSKIIDDFSDGYFHPQNQEYVSLDNLISLIAKENNRKVFKMYCIGKILSLLPLNLFNKLYGDLYYTFSIDSNSNKFSKFFIGFEESIKGTESNG